MTEFREYSFYMHLKIGIVIEVRLVQSRKAIAPILVMLFGMVIAVGWPFCLKSSHFFLPILIIKDKK